MILKYDEKTHKGVGKKTRDFCGKFLKLPLKLSLYLKLCLNIQKTITIILTHNYVFLILKTVSLSGNKKYSLSKYNTNNTFHYIINK